MVFRNLKNGQITSVPRYSTLDQYIMYHACRELGIPMPEEYREFEEKMNKIA
ncbi:hypothetical protein [Hymenobacter mucosus]|uniref:hypothetical protein n=1 Tax=Hymenobacter mucosus TaxID=1411120 RepID=UPI0015C58A3D|nr:hypothetical protein [Hymenobacter mucosus]